MGTDYHLGKSESIPTQTENRPVVPQGPPQGHYSADTGQWDGQLPHSDIAAQSNDPSQHQGPNWPTLLERMLWTRKVIRSFGLTAPQAAVLNEIAFRDGRGFGCTATMATIGLDTAYNEKSVRTAIKGLEAKKLILSNGAAGQKKILGLPVLNGQLQNPTPVTGSGVAVHDVEQTPVRDSGVSAEAQLPTPVRGSGVDQQTPVRDSGVATDPGKRFRATPVRDSDITLSKHNTEREEYINLSLISVSLPGSPVRDSGVTPDDVAEPQSPELRSEEPGSTPTSVRESEVANQRQEHEQERIRSLVVQNWPLLEKNGWQFLEAAIRHYQTHGITYLQRDLRVKRENLEKEELATRTCFHCKTVQESTDQLRECVMCHEPKCVSQISPCHRIGCDGKPASRNRAGPQSRQRQ